MALSLRKNIKSKVKYFFISQMTNAFAHNEQAATQDSTSTGTQARYNNRV